ncbi:MAG: DNA mismatch repair endonuclease MutL [Nitrospirae bacterium]|nr:DNA mismatch repair endonuclease MutL [Nitrospirota bacterium]MCL5284399.1 DNA mismatch repair endonuclease MutL [Nitrospirota bacterium]
MGIIRELPPSLVNQIAAGEVVERPASVLKELVENSLDAGATRISVGTDTAGIGHVLVRDNGAGIARDDLPRAFLRHATSKISSYVDLFSVLSMGFRGEALASIASVAKVTVETRHGSETVGTRLVLVPGQEPELFDWHGPVGTSLSVQDLFFNVPVRKKYLKSPQTEQGHLVEALNRLAMGFPEVQFDMATSARKILSLESRDSPYLRLLDLYPSLSEEDLALHELRGEDWRVQVFLLRPDRVRKDRQYQHLFINRRWIRHPGLFEAITQGAAGRISRDVHVGAWVYLDLPPEKLDVNVHPTKREVRLLEGDRLFSLVRRAIEEAFGLFDERVPSLAPPSSVTPSPGFPPGAGGQGETPVVQESAPESPAPFARESGPRPQPSSSRDPFRPGRKLPGLPGWTPDRPPSFERLPEILKGLPLSGRMHSPEEIVAVGTLAGTYILLTWGQDLAIVDWHTAHERINYEKYRRQVDTEGVRRIALLFPVVYRVPLSVADHLDNRLEELSRIGFDLDRTGPDAFRVRAIPFLLEGEDPVKALEGLRESSTDFEVPVLRSDRIDEILMTVSCHGSVRRNDILDLADSERLVRELLATPHSFTCPHGRPTMLRLSREDLDQWFGR